MHKLMAYGVLLAGCACTLPSAVLAQDYPRIDIVDFVVDWKIYAGKYVIVSGGVVNFTDTTSATLHAQGATVVIMAPFQNKEDLRYLLKNCAGVGARDKCAMEVFGLVDGETIHDFPVLKNPQTPIGNGAATL